MALTGAIALAGCAQEEPNYGAVICLEDHNQRHVLQSEFVRFYKQHGYEVEDYKYGVGHVARKFWGGWVTINFDLYKWDPERPMMIVTHLYIDADDPIVADYKTFIEQKWRGYERPGRTYSGNECLPAD